MATAFSIPKASPVFIYSGDDSSKEERITPLVANRAAKTIDENTTTLHDVLQRLILGITQPTAHNALLDYELGSVVLSPDATTFKYSTTALPAGTSIDSADWVDLPFISPQYLASILSQKSTSATEFSTLHSIPEAVLADMSGIKPSIYRVSFGMRSDGDELTIKLPTIAATETSSVTLYHTIAVVPVVELAAGAKVMVTASDGNSSLTTKFIVGNGQQDETIFHIHRTPAGLYLLD